MKLSGTGAISVGRILIGLGMAGGAVLLLLMQMARFPETSIRPKVQRAGTDMRALAAALERYHADHGVWPPLRIPTGYPPGFGSPFPALSTPIAYLDKEREDPFDERAGAKVYFDAGGYILVSSGPNGHADIKSPARFYRSDDPKGNTERLLGGGWTYDPTNGTQSPGDIWMIREQ